MKVLIDRDISWLYFNARVLREAENPSVPLLERLKFLAIFSSNLDEFFKVRVSQIRQLKEVDKSLRRKLAVKPNKHLKEIIQLVVQQQQQFGIALKKVISELEYNEIHLLSSKDFTPQEIEELYDTFRLEIAPMLQVQTPQDPGELKDGGLYLWVAYEKDKPHIVNIPSDHFSRFLVLSERPWRICFLDDVIKQFLPIFLGFQGIKGIYSIKLSRDAELYLDDDFTDAELVDKIRRTLHKRSKGQPTRLLYDQTMPMSEVQSLKEHLKLGEADMIPGGEYHHLSDFFLFPVPRNVPELVYEEMPPLPHPSIRQDLAVLDQIISRDHLLHLPFQSFDVFERFIEESATDPRVRTIRMTLYRLARTSDLADSLLKALDHGKQVVLFVEAQARFDEENNINWGNTFRQRGAQVIFSIPQIKVHSKICLIEGDFGTDKHLVAFIGTGNFNSQTARLYTDHGLFTSDGHITYDLSQVFKVLQREIIAPRLTSLVVSPFNTRLTFIDLIIKEIEHAEAGRRAGIKIKMNSLEDGKMIGHLIKASNKGVPVRLLVRGICRLAPLPADQVTDGAVPIEITSIVDRFLEHGRVYRFENGGEPKILIGSADWMTRNLDRRIEVLTPVEDPDLVEELEEILEIQFKDSSKARKIDFHLRNEKVKPVPGTPNFRSQYEIYNYLKEKSKHRDSNSRST